MSDIFDLRLVVVLLALCIAAIGANADSFTESFEGGSNVGGWAISTIDQIESSGGNPSAYLHAPYLDAGYPHPKTTELGTVFTGDYRARGVTSVSADLIVYTVEYYEARPCAIVLRDDNGTPSDWSDDWVAYNLGPDAPEPGAGWMSYEFTIPSGSDVWPADWSFAPLGPNSPTGDWPALMADVDELGFMMGDPAWGYIFQLWDVGLDNPSITYEDVVAVESRTWSGVKSMFGNKGQ